MQWGRYNSDFVLGNRPYVAAAMIGATYVSYNISLYATIPSPNSVNLMPMKAMVMTGSNFSDFQVCSGHLLHTHIPCAFFLGGRYVSLRYGSCLHMCGALQPWCIAARSQSQYILHSTG